MSWLLLVIVIHMLHFYLSHWQLFLSNNVTVIRLARTHHLQWKLHTTLDCKFWHFLLAQRYWKHVTCYQTNLELFLPKHICLVNAITLFTKIYREVSGFNVIVAFLQAKKGILTTEVSASNTSWWLWSFNFTHDNNFYC